MFGLYGLCSVGRAQSARFCASYARQRPSGFPRLMKGVQPWIVPTAQPTRIRPTRASSSSSSFAKRASCCQKHAARPCRKVRNSLPQSQRSVSVRGNGRTRKSPSRALISHAPSWKTFRAWRVERGKRLTSRVLLRRNTRAPLASLVDAPVSDAPKRQQPPDARSRAGLPCAQNWCDRRLRWRSLPKA